MALIGPEYWDLLGREALTICAPCTSGHPIQLEKGCGLSGTIQQRSSGVGGIGRNKCKHINALVSSIFTLPLSFFYIMGFRPTDL